MILAAVTAAVLVAAPLRADDKKDEKPKDRAGQLKEVLDDIQKALPDVIKEWSAAANDAEREKALAKLDPILERGYKLIAEDPKAESSLNALTELVRAKPQPPGKVLELLAAHHIDSPRLMPVTERLAGDTAPAAVKFLRTVMEKSGNKEVKGSATFACGQSLHQQAEEAGDPQKAAELNAEAEKYVEKSAHDYGEVHMGGESIKKQAEKLLFEIRNLSIGKTAPEVVSRDLDEKPTKLSDLKGKVVVVDIWATWCGPCRAMIPHEREMVEKLKDKPFALISISVDDKKETLKEFLENEKMPWTHWWEGRRDGGIMNDWNVKSFPTIYVIDAKGVIRHKGLRGKQLEEAVETLIEEAAKK